MLILHFETQTPLVQTPTPPNSKSFTNELKECQQLLKHGVCGLKMCFSHFSPVSVYPSETPYVAAARRAESGFKFLPGERMEGTAEGETILVPGQRMSSVSGEFIPGACIRQEGASQWAHCMQQPAAFSCFKD